MTDLSQKELLGWLKELYDAANTYGWGGDEDEQAYQQIKEIIIQHYGGKDGRKE